ncbi:MAG: hypothetical protein AB8C95_09235, partial [Phycisphaeraceae bacterium]
MRHDACILNTGQNAWAFEKVAQELAISINLDVRQSPSKKNYLLGCDSLPEPNTEHEYFVPLEAIQIASDKRLVAEAFTRNQVPTPNTFIVD